MKSKIQILLYTAIIPTFLFGCQATQRHNATTGELEINSASKGALVGALAGAAVGASVGNSSDALKGAAIGGLAGVGIGRYFDKQEAKLRQQLINSGVQVKRVANDEIQLVMENGIGFSSSSYLLQNTIYSTLNGVADVLQQYPNSKLEIIGHTDSQGDSTSNQTLSEQRAQSVANYLVNQNIAKSKISTKGYGESTPLCDNTTEKGRACNRRVEINISAS